MNYIPKVGDRWECQVSEDVILAVTRDAVTIMRIWTWPRTDLQVINVELSVITTSRHWYAGGGLLTGSTWKKIKDEE
jgi:hypothetical protein